MDYGGNKFKDKKVLVIGLGKSGLAAIKQLMPFAGSIIALDNNPSVKIKPWIKKISDPGHKLRVILDCNVNKRVELLKNIDIIVVSPGICSDIPLVRSADEMGTPVISEIELGWQLLKKKERDKTIAVTGTNGKTTVVTLLQEVISASGAGCIACGNIGNPLTSTIGEKPNGNLVRVIEVSSFQLERIIEFKPRIGIILNITDDHIDRHCSINNYADLKFRIFLNANSKDWGIFNIDDKNILSRLEKKQKYSSSKINIIRYSLYDGIDAEIYYDNNKIFYSICNKRGSIDLSGVGLFGKHNISNIMSVISASKILNINNRIIEKTVKGFKTLEHRLEYVCDVNGIRVFNDSKATNPDATIKALESFDKKITLILGGMDKDMDFSYLVPVLNKRVKNVLLIGQTKEKIFNDIKSFKGAEKQISFRTFNCRSLKDAVDKGLAAAKSGEILLLSPACASFDMFDDYRDRGHKFKKLIMDIKNGK